MKNNKLKILFFILGPTPTEKEIEIASEIEAKVCFRNALFFDEGAGLENCDYVLGAVPLKYLKNGFELWGSEFLSTILENKEVEEQKEEIKKPMLGWISNS